MQRSDFVIKLMSVVLFIALAAYIGLYIFNTANKPLVTAVAVTYTVQDSGSTEGYIVRRESVLPGDGSSVTLMAEEGEKLAAGQAVAVHYQGEAALARASSIRALQLEIKEAEKTAAISADQKAAGADAGILDLAAAVQHQHFSNIEDLALRVKQTVFTKSSGQTSDTELAAMKNELAQLLSESSDTNTVYAPISGVFSAAVDGYEEISPDKLDGLMPSSLSALFSPAQSPGDAALGKLITGIKWYYAAVMDAAVAQKLNEKTTATLQFTKSYNARLIMTIENVGAEEDGKCVVIFSSDRSLSAMTALRQLTAQIEFSTLTGLSIPKEAVYHETENNEDKTLIYLLTGLQAEKIYVDILSENGDSYIVKNGTENGTVLREGSEIIVKGKDLYDGKVVGR